MPTQKQEGELRRISFTVFNATVEDLTAALQTSGTLYHAFVCEAEVCPTTGKAHIQAYIELDGRGKRPRSFIKSLGLAGHHETARGSRKANFLYCTKDYRAGTVGEYFATPSGEPYSAANDWAPNLFWGTDPKQGNRTVKQSSTEKFIQARDAARGGMTVNDMVNSDKHISLLTCGRNLEKIVDAVNSTPPPPSGFKRKVIIIYGAPATGKSTLARQLRTAPGEDPSTWYEHSAHQQYWSNLTSKHRTLLLEDIDGLSNISCSLQLMKELLDVNNPYITLRGLLLFLSDHTNPTTEIYKPERQVRFDRVIILSNEKPSFWFTKLHGQLRRPEACLDGGWTTRTALPAPDHLMNDRGIQVIQVGSNDWVAAGTHPAGKIPLQYPIIWGPDEPVFTGMAATSLPQTLSASAPGSSQEDPICLDD